MVDPQASFGSASFYSNTPSTNQIVQRVMESELNQSPYREEFHLQTRSNHAWSPGQNSTYPQTPMTLPPVPYNPSGHNSAQPMASPLPFQTAAANTDTPVGYWFQPHATSNNANANTVHPGEPIYVSLPSHLDQLGKHYDASTGPSSLGNGNLETAFMASPNYSRQMSPIIQCTQQESAAKRMYPVNEFNLTHHHEYQNQQRRLFNVNQPQPPHYYSRNVEENDAFPTKNNNRGVVVPEPLPFIAGNQRNAFHFEHREFNSGLSKHLTRVAVDQDRFPHGNESNHHGHPNETNGRMNRIQGHDRETGSQNRGKGCRFCRANNEEPVVFRSHRVTDKDGNTTCPILREYICPICKATGDFAHTRRYCPVLRANQHLHLQNNFNGVTWPMACRKIVTNSTGNYIISRY